MLRQALIPAAGRGVRLDLPDTPKPLVEVGGQPLIVRLLKQMARAGLERAVVVTGFQGRRIVGSLAGRRDLGLEVSFVENPAWPEGLASSILAARSCLSGPFLLSMADHVFDYPLVDRMARVIPSEGEAVLLADPRPERVFDLESAVKVQHSGWWLLSLGVDLKNFNAVDAGLVSAGPELFKELEEALRRTPQAGLTEGLERLARRGLARVELAKEHGWDDVDTPAAMVHAEQRLRERRRLRVVGAARAVVRARAEDRAADRSDGPDRAERRGPDGAGAPDRAGTGTPDPAGFEFATGRSVTTHVVVGRGFCSRPAEMSLIQERSASSPLFVFTDETVNRLYGRRFVSSLRRAGYDAYAIVMADGEESKTLANYAHLVERVLGKGTDERSVFISLGGGAVCNVCGFVASTLYRGLGLVHVPTTLMAQCDAAISHKQGVNGPRGKNLLGSYYAPERVVVDIDVLATLKRRLLYDGLAEAIKHALGQDPQYVEMLLEYPGDVRDPDFLESVVRRNIRLKCALMSSDPCEQKQGMVLQYGHTVGHPLEVLSGYSMYHGESVAVGMMVAVRVARLMSLCTDETVEIHDRLLRKYRLPVTVPKGIRPADVLCGLKYNKRYLVEGTRMALLSSVGELFNLNGEYAVPVADSVILRALGDTMEGETCATVSQWSPGRAAASGGLRSPGW